MKTKIGICIGIILVLILCFFVDLLIIGEPVDGNQLAYTANVSGSAMELKVSATESAMALHGWNFQQEGTVLSIRARKVLASPLFPSGEYQTSMDLEGITHIYLGGQLIWKCDEKT